MTHDMIHDHGEKPITIENCVIEHSQTHQLFIKLRQGKSQPGKRFGYPVLISIDFDEFRSPFIAQFLFRLKRYINTRVSVSSIFQTPRIWFKIIRCASYFQLSSQCLDILVKHCLSCLIYYFQYQTLPFRAIQGLSSNRTFLLKLKTNQSDCAVDARAKQFPALRF